MTEPRFTLNRVPGAPVTDEELLDDLRRVAANLNQETVQMPKYREDGRYDETTVARRFGTWNKALVAAGLKLSNEIGISDERLFENILSLWQEFGRQPRRAELASEIPKFSQGPYNRRFGSWGAALKAFVDYANAIPDDEVGADYQRTFDQGKRSPRDPSLRLRYKVLVRDGFRCCICGASPATHVGVTLHVDHIQPWSKGGETTQENLRTTCAKCNLGKGNLFIEGG